LKIGNFDRYSISSFDRYIRCTYIYIFDASLIEPRFHDEACSWNCVENVLRRGIGTSSIAHHWCQSQSRGPDLRAQFRSELVRGTVSTGVFSCSLISATCVTARHSYRPGQGSAIRPIHYTDRTRTPTVPFTILHHPPLLIPPPAPSASIAHRRRARPCGRTVYAPTPSRRHSSRRS